MQLLEDYEEHLRKESLREKVCALIPCHKLLKKLGGSLIPRRLANTGRDRILAYFQKYPLTVISGDELAVLSGIGEWARRIRELRKEFGWSILNGATAKSMMKEGELSLEGIRASALNNKSYILTSQIQDKEAAYRWHVANSIRRMKLSMIDKILRYLKENVGKPVTGEELKYLAGDKTSWARRTRQLRTEHGWSLFTRNSGRTDLPVGVYILESLKQQAAHDRKIPDKVRVAVLGRDKQKCTNCSWDFDKKNPADPRVTLELHHIKHHAARGANSPDNLVTLCNVCHDDVHRATPTA